MLSFNLLYHPETLRVSVIPFKTYFLSEEILSVCSLSLESRYEKDPSFKVILSVPSISVALSPIALAFITVYLSSPEIVPKFEKSLLSLLSTSVLAEYLVPSTLKASP